jgi:DNA topoisomerase-1
MSPKETTALCQQLYQDGHITYIRTDSMKYSSSFISEIINYIKGKYGLNDSYIGNTKEIENKDETNPHEAIRVTHIETETIKTENSRMLALYKLIWRNTIESCMSIYKYSVETVYIDAPFDLKYKTEVEMPLFLGWKKITEKNERTETTNIQNDGKALLLLLKSIQSSKQSFSYNCIQSNVCVRGTEKYYTEATLIKKLEDLGIGRPSTFASIVETIQERGYVKKMDVEGIKKIVNEYVLYKDKEVEMKPTEKQFGQSKNKLVIQSVGVLTIEFLIKNFNPLFSYEYTKDLEIELDEITNKTFNKPWYEICRKCKDEIKDLIKKTSVEKPEYKIDDNHILIYEKYGPVLKIINEENPTYISVKKDIEIDLEKLKNGDYHLEDLIETRTKSLGKYENEEIYVKNGKYGWYVEWGSNKKSIKNIEKPLETLELNDIIEFIENGNEKEKGNHILRELNENLSIRRGKYGAYIYYKKSCMKKPEFLNIKKFKGSYLFCEKQIVIDWINETYKLNETLSI